MIIDGTPFFLLENERELLVSTCPHITFTILHSFSYITNKSGDDEFSDKARHGIDECSL
jgi:hypothetical protein